MSLELSGRFYGFNKKTRRIASSYHKLLKDPSIREDITTTKTPNISIDLSEATELRIFASHQDIFQTDSSTDKADSELCCCKSKQTSRLLEGTPQGDRSPKWIELSVKPILVTLSIILVVGAFTDMSLKSLDLMSSSFVYPVLLIEKVLLHVVCICAIARHPQKIGILIPYALSELGITLGCSEQLTLEKCRSLRKSASYDNEDEKCIWFNLILDSRAWLSLLTVMGTIGVFFVLIIDSLVSLIKSEYPETPENGNPAPPTVDSDSDPPPQTLNN